MPTTTIDKFTIVRALQNIAHVFDECAAGRPPGPEMWPDLARGVHDLRERLIATTPEQLDTASGTTRVAVRVFDGEPLDLAGAQVLLRSHLQSLAYVAPELLRERHDRLVAMLAQVAIRAAGNGIQLADAPADGVQHATVEHAPPADPREPAQRPSDGEPAASVDRALQDLAGLDPQNLLDDLRRMRGNVAHGAWPAAVSDMRDALGECDLMRGRLQRLTAALANLPDESEIPF